MERLARALDMAQGLANVLRGHADLGDYLPPKTTRGLAEMAQQIAAEIGAVLGDVTARAEPRE